MERHYTVFISYRHKALDGAVASHLQRLIEGYTVPKDKRKDGRKRLGLVFRDRTELPLNSSLPDSIHIALDHSDYLAVICTPDLLESSYCMDEIDYFLKHHDPDHVLTILAAGKPETAFPEALRFRRDAVTGEVVENEPLAANVVAPSISGSKRKLNREFLRVVAGILDCPFDELYRRHRRTRRRQIAGFAAMVACTALLVTLIGASIYRLTQPDPPKPYNELLSTDVLQDAIDTYLLAGGMSETMLDLTQAATEPDPQIYEGWLREYEDFYGNRPYSSEAELETLNDLLESGEIVPWSGIPMDRENCEKLFGLPEQNRDRYNDIILQIDRLSGSRDDAERLEEYVGLAGELIQGDISIIACLYDLVCKPHLTGEHPSYIATSVIPLWGSLEAPEPGDDPESSVSKGLPSYSSLIPLTEEKTHSMLERSEAEIESELEALRSDRDALLESMMNIEAAADS